MTNPSTPTFKMWEIALPTPLRIDAPDRIERKRKINPDVVQGIIYTRQGVLRPQSLQDTPQDQTPAGVQAFASYRTHHYHDLQVLPYILCEIVKHHNLSC